MDPGRPLRQALAAGVIGIVFTFTRFMAPAQPTGPWRAYDRWPFARRPPDAPLWRLTDAFAPLAHDALDASTFGKWTPAPASRVAPTGRLVLAGVSTDCCVLSTALADAGAEVPVVADACAGADGASHAQALHLMDLYRPLVRVTTVAELLRTPATRLLGPHQGD
ncbi:isochorismatase family protein [Streptomyces sp. NY05-11A]|nr:isochorismatase family protein [Streptomyces sp. NY05-11A]MDX2676493.1 isochorismatase family protein [Streptomyces sp. NY05-11A]